LSKTDLEKLIVHLATLYDNGLDCVDFSGQLVSDSEYDALVRKLHSINPSSVVFSKKTTSPSKFTPTGTLVVHNPPITSIAKADGDDKKEIYEKWIKDCCTELGYEYPPKSGRFAQSYKHDGVAIRVYYKDGILVSAGLRPRDGVNGIDVTANVAYVKGIPSKLPLPLTLAIGGELECLLSDFEKVQEKLKKAGEDLRKNPRNHTYGSINQQKDPSKTADGLISFVGYNITGFDDSDKYYKTEVERAKWVNKVLKVPFVQMRDHEFSDLAKMEAGVPNLDYEVDGVVLKVNNLEDFEQLGHHGDVNTGEPRGALAWKFQEEKKTAIVHCIEWNASRTGRIVPVAIFKDPINLAGTLVSRATCSNFGWLEKMQIGPDAVVEVIKAGKIIPKIVNVLKLGLPVDCPQICPSCSSNTELSQNLDNTDVICKNDTCPAKMVNKFVFYLSSLGAKGLGESKIEQMISKLSDLNSLYLLRENDLISCGFTERESLLALCTIHGVKPSSSNVVIRKELNTAFSVKKKYVGWQFFGALGIPRAGRTVGKLLFEHFGDFSNIRKASKEDLISIDGIGDVVADSIVEYFSNNKNELDLLMNHIEFEKAASGKLSGKKFVLSGSFSEGKSYWEDQITKLGGTISSSVGSKTNYLIAGDGSGSKSEKAKSLGIPILNIAELKKLL
jgi:DNA ligase (NAD+)